MPLWRHSFPRLPLIPAATRSRIAGVGLCSLHCAACIRVLDMPWTFHALLEVKASRARLPLSPRGKCFGDGARDEKSSYFPTQRRGASQNQLARKHHAEHLFLPTKRREERQQKSFRLRLSPESIDPGHGHVIRKRRSPLTVSKTQVR